MREFLGMATKGAIWMTERKASQSKMVYLFAVIGLVGIIVLGIVQAYILQFDVIETTTASPKW